MLKPGQTVEWEDRNGNKPQGIVSQILDARVLGTKVSIAEIETERGYIFLPIPRLTLVDKTIKALRAFGDESVKASKGSKFKNEKITDPVHGVFDSKREYARFCQLLLLERAGEISELKRQVKYPLDSGGIHFADYWADFEYVDKRGVKITEDSKGCRTNVYVKKRRLMKQIYGITILET